jgi:hypothetical protein
MSSASQLIVDRAWNFTRHFRNFRILELAPNM